MFTLGTQEYERIAPTPFRTARELSVARSISLSAPIFRRNDRALDWLAKQRWGYLGGGLQACPSCGSIDRHYWLSSRKLWKCRAKLCHAQFSVTTGTKFHSTKLEPQQIASLLFHWQETAEGMSSRTLAGLFGTDYAAMSVQVSKIREAILETVDTSPLSGTVEADAAYFNRHVRPPNKGTGVSFGEKASQKDTGQDPTGREKYRRNPNLHALVAFVQRREDGGIGRVRITAIKTENQVDLLACAREFVSPEATVITDEHVAYNLFAAVVDVHKRVKHRELFMDDEGNHTNHVECYFGELRRAQSGAFHRMGLGYLRYYAAEIAWRLEMRDVRNEVRLEDLAQRCLRSGPSTQFADVWNKRPPSERIAKPNEPGIIFEVPKGSVKRKPGRKARATAKLKTRLRSRKGRQSASAPRGSPSPSRVGSAGASAAQAD